MRTMFTSRLTQRSTTFLCFTFVSYDLYKVLRRTVCVLAMWNYFWEACVAQVEVSTSQSTYGFSVAMWHRNSIKVIRR